MCSQEEVQVTLYSQQSRTLDELREAPGSKTLCITVSLPLQKPTKTTKKKREPAGFKRPPALLRQWPIQDKLRGLRLGTEVNFNETFSENTNEHIMQGVASQTKEEHYRLWASPPPRVKYERV